ncbi:glycosyltransferase [Thalassotalea eurytherma]|uniref:glycosyltransferase n=1 Tax=Thalassotalea eurytherma TaxID=1144278 RepID=UPI0024E0B0DF|nr:glycosyltransferase [Thalassotalea eurytherma]
MIKQWALQKVNAFYISSPRISSKNHKGYLTFASNSAIHGWLVNENGSAVTHLRLLVNGVETTFHLKRVFRKDVKLQYGVESDCGFEIYFTADDYQPKTFEIQLLENNSNTVLFDSEIKYQCSEATTIAKARRCHNANQLVDVVIPVYAGFEITKNCIESVLASKNTQPFRMLTINDCSPDPELSQWLRDIATKEPLITLIENPQNLGFVQSVNKGMQFDRANHVVLLNSDTVVSDNWLDRLVYPLTHESNIASITPLSNNATIFSFPNMNPSSDLPLADSVESINQALFKYNAQSYVDVPTGHGFCMLIPREAIDTFGVFDHKTWGKGYGEENDFCLKASRHGWRNIAACDVFVQHVGSVSFGESAAKRVEKNLAILEKRYPDYLNSVNCFINADPLRQYRNKPSQYLLLKSQTNRKSIIHIIHSLGGGTEYAMQRLITLSIKEGVDCYILRSINNGQLYRLENADQSLSVVFDRVSEFSNLINLLQKLSIELIHYHQLLDFDDDIKLLPRQLDVDYDIALHDYYLMCPRVNMLRKRNDFCGFPSLESCHECLSNSGPHPSSRFIGSSLNKIQQFWQDNNEFLSKARMVVSPSNATKKLFENHFNGLEVISKVHPEDVVIRQLIELDSESSRVNVAVIGALGEHKGIARFKALLTLAEKQFPSLHFVLFGYGSDSLNKYKNLTITGKYKVSELKCLVSNFQCDRALFLSPWPETFSYTLSEAFELGLYPIAPDIGAFSERIMAAGVGQLYSLGDSNEHLLHLLEKTHSSGGEYTVGKQYNNILLDYYELT